jgi:hydrogenase maturation protease
MCKIVVIGIGNPLLCDDSAGLHVVSRLQSELETTFKDIVFSERYSGGMELLDDLIGRTHALIIDSIIDPAIPPGSIAELLWKDIELVRQDRIAASHGLNLPTVVDFGKKCGIHMPLHIAIIAIGGQDFSRFSEKPTDEVEKGVCMALECAKKKVYYWKHVSSSLIANIEESA